ncbi:hyaluronidase-like isoform X2 [Aphidius gifuensis]|uniref:hyaluronidase-like isoform X2 n=1 Tax=Aphidius gifuensis TaxID=684658 RepID=UPI001CDBB966|nr:hyaluronidase-like isoform X2 [Aphidius gifuensis]
MNIIVIILVIIPLMEASFLGIAQTIFGGNENYISSHTSQDYKVYWNIPTFMCHQYGINFDDVKNFGIEQNENDNFRGEKIAILYDPGMFPALLKHPNASLTIRNGGVPQEVIDFESWRPIFRQNWASLAAYRDFSIHIENKKHPHWDKWSIEHEAVQRFETAGRVFMEETLKLAKTLRPYASWSYYAYPYCFNLSPQQSSYHCHSNIREENDKLFWLWKLEDIMLPSVYLRNSLSSNEKIGLITGRLEEAKRLVDAYKPQSKILPYFWYKYQDQKDIFLSKIDIVNGFKEMIKRGADGHILWGSSNDFSTKEKCKKFKYYLNDILGPAVNEARHLLKLTRNSVSSK